MDHPAREDGQAFSLPTTRKVWSSPPTKVGEKNCVVLYCLAKWISNLLSCRRLENLIWSVRSWKVPLSLCISLVTVQMNSLPQIPGRSVPQADNGEGQVHGQANRKAHWLFPKMINFPQLENTLCRLSSTILTDHESEGNLWFFALIERNSDKKKSDMKLHFSSEEICSYKSRSQCYQQISWKITINSEKVEKHDKPWRYTG